MVIRAEARLALTRFHVTHKGEYANDLLPDDIQVLQDGKPQELAVFEGPQTGPRTIPVELIFLLDVSLSVLRPGLLNESILKSTVLAGLDEHARISVYGFAQHLQRFCKPTRDLSVLKKALSDAYEFEHWGTRLYEVIAEVCRDSTVSDRNALRVMIIFSDGMETGEAKSKDAVKVAEEFDVKLYPVVLGHERVLQRTRMRNRAGGQQTAGLPGPNSPSGGRQNSINPRRSQSLYWIESQMMRFADIGSKTGGRSFDPRELNAEAMASILQNIVAAVRSEYVVGYYTPSPLKKGKHKIKVVLRNKAKGKIKGGKKEFVVGNNAK